jgi:two-component system OmpR family response regulator
MTILVIEDDARMARMLQRGLANEGYQVEHVGDGEQGLSRLRVDSFVACVLDVRLPGRDGFSVVEEARRHGVRTPILLLTARDEIADRVHGLNLGADDYLVKPFAFAELLARLRALHRRGTPGPQETLRHAGLTLDPAAHRVAIDGEPITLSARQFALLAYLLRNAGEVVSRAMLLEHVFEYKFDPHTNVVDVHVAHLRQKIDTRGRPSLIETVRGVGYRMRNEHG